MTHAEQLVRALADVVKPQLARRMGIELIDDARNVVGDVSQLLLARPQRRLRLFLIGDVLSGQDHAHGLVLGLQGRRMQGNIAQGTVGAAMARFEMTGALLPKRVVKSVPDALILLVGFIEPAGVPADQLGAGITDDFAEPLVDRAQDAL